MLRPRQFPCLSWFRWSCVVCRRTLGRGARRRCSFTVWVWWPRWRRPRRVGATWQALVCGCGRTTRRASLPGVFSSLRSKTAGVAAVASLMPSGIPLASPRWVPQFGLQCRRLQILRHRRRRLHRRRRMKTKVGMMCRAGRALAVRCRARRGGPRSRRRLRKGIRRAPHPLRHQRRRGRPEFKRRGRSTGGPSLVQGAQALVAWQVQWC